MHIMLAHAVANETTWPFYELSPTLGTFPQAISEVCSQALSTAPSIIFIDNLDDIALGSHWGLLVSLLKECDRHVILIGAVEQPNLLDSELTGLFTINIHIGLPDEVSRMEIVPLMVSRLEAEGYNVEGFDDESVKFVAKCTQGLSCTELKEWLRKFFLQT
ncbi:P-loop containing nucleoside triphosphate hydrolase [Sesbania bispinosa]|nr:P-loop containing nucleoside triphosphate hydrolase [Sesbania bispinosa]